MKFFNYLMFSLLAALLILSGEGAFALNSHTSKVFFDHGGNRMVVYNGGSILYYTGNGLATFAPEGVISQQFSAAGVGNAADTTDDALFTYSLPASTLVGTNQSLRITCFGHAASTTNNKTIKLWFGSEVVSSGVVTTNNKNWSASMIVGRTALSTQQVYGNMLVDVTPITGYSAAGAETETGAITIKCTGASGTTGAASDLLGYGMTVETLN